MAVVLGHTNSITRAFFSPFSKAIVTSSTDSTIRIWPFTLNAEKCLVSRPSIMRCPESHATTDPLFLLSSLIVAGSNKGSIYVWNPQFEHPLHNYISGPHVALTSLAKLTDGNHCVVGRANGSLDITNVLTNIHVGTLPPHDTEIVSTHVMLLTQDQISTLKSFTGPAANPTQVNIDLTNERVDVAVSEDLRDKSVCVVSNEDGIISLYCNRKLIGSKTLPIAINKIR